MSSSQHLYPPNLNTSIIEKPNRTMPFYYGLYTDKESPLQPRLDYSLARISLDEKKKRYYGN